ncbi:hypothetical protein BDP27DRAFT_1413150 [Rhodocollybia butyracea]|uniref:Uncharacterized protein n=1 Tax=Rhodocollybia butyracea TaxID=206335 RepID=A0A9P5QBE4_9AGAR|nr:hypothetical protein BDP27DRAFT_1413150 [Rhodocollybia butyracea]
MVSKDTIAFTLTVISLPLTIALAIYKSLTLPLLINNFLAFVSKPDSIYNKIRLVLHYVAKLQLVEDAPIPVSDIQGIIDSHAWRVEHCPLAFSTRDVWMHARSPAKFSWCYERKWDRHLLRESGRSVLTALLSPIDSRSPALSSLSMHTQLPLSPQAQPSSSIQVQPPLSPQAQALFDV